MKKKLLIVDDDQGIRNNLQALFESEGYRVEAASNGVEALQILRGPGDLPSLIILDLMMPLMDGFRFRAAQELDPSLAPIPIIITTAGGNIDSKAYKLGAKGFLRKPFNLNEVLTTVERFAR